MQKKRSRIQIINQQKVLDAATDIFAKYGFRGGTIDQIAEMAGMSKPNLLYYFKTKKEIYLAVLEQTLNKWLQCLQDWQVTGTPEETISNYIDTKLEFSRNHAAGSRVFANEIMEGAPILKTLLGEDLKRLVDEDTKVIKGWVKNGDIRPIDPIHLIFMIWAVTQHYADFETQIETLTGKTLQDEDFYKQAKKTVKQIILGGVLKES
ncbi:TetR family transcriptional regulator C-terminal domain-containing protein [Paremcibacter congregatus]|uniref:TetR family transcriptional regulator n=1 Tax=Paremcibacter congregatus TaxID=2043170 RepID=A0A2G4YTH8_9PROT|nr:TetR family transcriptional regulator C-terminal domain-containing protein [Paremcibacter congregatus]PHZ85550.1 TetR family transcriptional regulator [Paremcibacter congregatus]QDE26510.1 TetR family transcriptional regulator [Paremcibacter congregatus]|tara:strand:+ start:5017 stop:5637 length:621 start_codon:yes stop_codon:yes gene_type:complete